MSDQIVLKILSSTLTTIANTSSDETSRAIALDALKNIAPIQTLSNSGNIQEAKAYLRQANDYCTQALRHNGIKWSQSTDRAIEHAATNVVKALSLL